MSKDEVIKQGEHALSEMLRAREAYCNSKTASVTAEVCDAVIDTSTDDIDCCCLGVIFMLLLAIPFLIFSKIEKNILDKKAQPIMHQAKSECMLYAGKMQEYLKMHPDNRIFLQACIAFGQNSYIGPLRKKKVFFGLLQMDEDWHMRSIDMAIQDIRYHLDVIKTH